MRIEALRTDRLVLRPYAEGDEPFLADLLSRPDVVRYLYIREQTPAEVKETLLRRVRQTSVDAPGDGVHFAVSLASSGKPVGDTSLKWLPGPHRQGEIGFVFHPDHHGHGYATEAAREMLRLGFEQLGLHRVCGRLEPRNAASAHVLERLGMRLEAHFRENEWIKGEWQSELVYAMLAEEWPTASAMA